MSRILVDTTPARGHLFPATPIMDELHSRGHNIALRTLGSQVPMMRKRGFDVAPIDPRIEEIAINDYLGRTPFDAQKRAMRVFCERARFDAVARRVEVAQAGTRLAASRLRPDRLRDAVREALGRAEGAKRVAAAFAAARGPKAAADAFENFGQGAQVKGRPGRARGVRRPRRPRCTPPIGSAVNTRDPEDS
jgi:UDP:flavonoid glycosyltransferase YjiC (YdhE family)